MCIFEAIKHYLDQVSIFDILFDLILIGGSLVINLENKYLSLWEVTIS